jgi:hypothetical protein
VHKVHNENERNKSIYTGTSLGCGQRGGTPNRRRKSWDATRTTRTQIGLLRLCHHRECIGHCCNRTRGAHHPWTELVECAVPVQRPCVQKTGGYINVRGSTDASNDWMYFIRTSNAEVPPVLAALILHSPGSPPILLWRYSSSDTALRRCASALRSPGCCACQSTSALCVASWTHARGICTRMA